MSDVNNPSRDERISVQMLKELADVVGDANVLSGEKVLERDPGYCETSQNAGVLVRPGSTDEMSQVVSIARNHGVSLVPQGGLTGLVKGTASEPGNIIISTQRMNKILRVDAAQGILIAESGVTLATANAAANEHGMMLGVDIPSRDSCTLGGIVSTNAGGVRVIRYGMTRENVLGLTAVLSDGTIIDANNTLMKNNAGYDLKHFFIGSEGTLGVVTNIVFKLYPKPVREHTALVAANSFADLQKLLVHCRGELGASLLSFELMWGDHYQKITATPGYGSIPITESYPLYAIVEAGVWRSSDNLNPLEEVLGAALEDNTIVDAVLSNSEAERTQIWRAREDTDSLTQDGNTLQGFDVGIELQDMVAYVDRLRTDMAKKWPDKPVYIFGHMGDSNLHIVLSNSEEENKQYHEFEEVVYGITAEFTNSTVSAEHGIGLEKQEFLPRTRSAAQIALMKQIQQNFDPAGTLNPGKIVS